MLTLTPNASAVVKQIVDQNGGTDEAGLRISQESVDSPSLEVSPTPAPESGDEVVEAAGARVFLESTAARTLEDKILDAQVDPEGAVQFSIEVQQPLP